jgi:hypothetical protein
VERPRVAEDQQQLHQHTTVEKQATAWHKHEQEHNKSPAQGPVDKAVHTPADRTVHSAYANEAHQEQHHTAKPESIASVSGEVVSTSIHEPAKQEQEHAQSAKQDKITTHAHGADVHKVHDHDKSQQQKLQAQNPPLLEGYTEQQFPAHLDQNSTSLSHEHAKNLVTYHRESGSPQIMASTREQHITDQTGRNSQPQQQRVLTLEQQREIQLQLQTQLRLQREEHELYAGLSRHRGDVSTDNASRILRSANVSMQEERFLNDVSMPGVKPARMSTSESYMTAGRDTHRDMDDERHHDMHVLSAQIFPSSEDPSQYALEANTYRHESKMRAQNAEDSQHKRRQQDEELVHSIIQEQRYDSWCSSRDFTSPTDKSSSIALMLQQARYVL